MTLKKSVIFVLLVFAISLSGCYTGGSFLAQNVTNIELAGTNFDIITTVTHDGRGVFSGLPKQFDATRYHSLVIEESSVPEILEISARTDDGEIMGVRHRSLPIEGVQFHPESIMTAEGKQLLRNFLERCGREGGAA